MWWPMNRCRPSLRRLLSATVVSYAADMPLLRQRFHRYLSREVIGTRIIAVFHWVLSLRQELRDSVLSLAVQVALSEERWLHKAVRDRRLDDAARLRLRLARIDLSNWWQPERLAAERFAARL